MLVEPHRFLQAETLLDDQRRPATTHGRQPKRTLRLAEIGLRIAEEHQLLDFHREDSGVNCQLFQPQPLEHSPLCMKVRCCVV
jgi:hypothetical protein